MVHRLTARPPIRRLHVLVSQLPELGVSRRLLLQLVVSDYRRRLKQWVLAPAPPPQSRPVMPVGIGLFAGGPLAVQCCWVKWRILIYFCLIERDILDLPFCTPGFERPSRC